MKKRKHQSNQITRFILVGIVNTIIGTSIMFFAYNVLGFGYWISSALNYICGSVFSYFANKYYTFNKTKKSLKEIYRFSMNILICYILAYSIAAPLCEYIFKAMISDNSILEQIALVFGMVIFVILNFLGQKILVFK